MREFKAETALISIIFVLAILIFNSGFVTGADTKGISLLPQDTIKAYNSQTQEVLLLKYDLSGSFAKLKLNTPLNMVITNLGYNLVGEIEINGYEDYTSILDSLKSYDLNDGKEIEINFENI